MYELNCNQSSSVVVQLVSVLLVGFTGCKNEMGFAFLRLFRFRSVERCVFIDGVAW